jgi:hypothetical protein
MESSQPNAQRNDGTAASEDTTPGDPQLRGASTAPDLGAERRPLRAEPVDDPKAKPGGETPGREPYDPHSSS